MLKKYSSRLKTGRSLWLMLLLGIAVQGSFMFNGGSMAQIIVSVILFSLVSFMAILFNYGLRTALAIVVTVMLIGFSAEALGVAINFPFGEYAYTGGLGWSLAGVSLIVPLAWLMMSYPAWMVSRKILSSTSRAATAGRVLLAAFAMVMWDVFLDTQMVEAGNWGWANPEPSLFLTPGIPLTNYVGWFFVSLVIMICIELILRKKNVKSPESSGDEYPVYGVYLWTWLGSTIANATFWARPELAIAGFTAMGLLCVPLLMKIWLDIRAQKRAVVG